MAIIADTGTRPRGLLFHDARTVISTVVYGAVLFGAAGTIFWTAAWLYLAVITLVLLTYAAVVVGKHPELIAERTKPPADAKAWDRPFVFVIAFVGPFAFIILSGLDHRFGWTDPLPAGALPAGLLLVLAGGMLANRAVAENAFFSALVRIQRDRGHRVVDSGPYAVVRHPGYLGSIVASIGGPLALGSLWALALNAAIMSVLAVRTAVEDRTLQQELEGYREYARRVRWRLVPFVW